MSSGIWLLTGVAEMLDGNIRLCYRCIFYLYLIDRKLDRINWKMNDGSLNEIGVADKLWGTGETEHA